MSMAHERVFECTEVGIFAPEMRPRRASRARRRRLRDRQHQIAGRDRRGRYDNVDKRAGARPAAGIPQGRADGLLRPLSERRRLRRPARRTREAQAQRCRARLRARNVGGARLRLSLRFPRPAAHGDRAGAPRARLRPRSDRNVAVGRLSHHQQRRHRCNHRQSFEAARAERDALDRGAVRKGDDDLAARVRRRDHGDHAEPAGHARSDGVSARRPGDPHLRDAVDRSHRRFLRRCSNRARKATRRSTTR